MELWNQLPFHLPRISASELWSLLPLDYAGQVGFWERLNFDFADLVQVELWEPVPVLNYHSDTGEVESPFAGNDEELEPESNSDMSEERLNDQGVGHVVEASFDSVELKDSEEAMATSVMSEDELDGKCRDSGRGDNAKDSCEPETEINSNMSENFENMEDWGRGRGHEAHTFLDPKFKETEAEATTEKFEEVLDDKQSGFVNIAKDLDPDFNVSLEPEPDLKIYEASLSNIKGGNVDGETQVLELAHSVPITTNVLAGQGDLEAPECNTIPKVENFKMSREQPHNDPGPSRPPSNSNIMNGQPRTSIEAVRSLKRFSSGNKFVQHWYTGRKLTDEQEIVTYEDGIFNVTCAVNVEMGKEKSLEFSAGEAKVCIQVANESKRNLRQRIRDDRAGLGLDSTGSGSYYRTCTVERDTRTILRSRYDKIPFKTTLNLDLSLHLKWYNGSRTINFEYGGIQVSLTVTNVGPLFRTIVNRKMKSKLNLLSSEVWNTVDIFYAEPEQECAGEVASRPPVELPNKWNHFR